MTFSYDSTVDELTKSATDTTLCPLSLDKIVQILSECTRSLQSMISAV